jgi:filamentous hemagglutinin family protein
MVMQTRLQHLQQWTVPFVWVVSVCGSPAYAQVLPAQDGTGTQVDRQGDRFDISGGTQSGANLFHSFDELSIKTGETANFAAGSDVFNIVGRVSGQNPSYINGQVQVSSSEANLYLINPAGVMFGPDAQLSLQGSFTATTADQVNFGEAWLKAADREVDYSQLAAGPSAFRFTAEHASSIVNQGDLAVEAGESLTLVGGSVVSTGSLSAPGGEVGLVAVGGKSSVRYSVPGSLLSLEVNAESATVARGDALQTTDLPALITGSPVQGASTLIVNADGSVTLGGSGVEGASVAVSGEISVRSPQGTAESTAESTGGTVALLGNSVTVTNAIIDASGAAGGTVRIGGDYQGNNAGASHLPTASHTLLDADSVIRADGLSGEGGNVVVWADDEATLQGTISATGATQGGFVETSAHSLDITRLNVDASGQTAAGTWLLDPTDLTIVSGATGPNEIDPTMIQNQLDSGTNVALQTTMAPGSGSGDIWLLNSIDQLGGGSASLSLTGRRFSANGTGSTINLTSTGGLSFNLNQINPEAVSSSSSIGSAIASIGNVSGHRLISLGAGAYDFLGPVSIGTQVEIEGSSASATLLRDISGSRIFNVSAQGSAFLHDLSFTTNAISSFGGGIRNNGGIVNVEDSLFTGNRAVHGGAINSQGGTLTVGSSEFLGNQAAGSGGAIRVANGAISNISGNTIFRNNHADDDAGALKIENSVVTIQNTAFENNDSTDAGGAVGVHGLGSALFDTVVFEGNTSGSVGGAIATWDGTQISLIDSVLTGNRALADGGAISSVDGSRLSIANTRLEGNTATGSGGGLFQNSGTLTISAGNFRNNRSNSDGGGIALTGSVASILNNNTKLIGNSAVNNGGGFSTTSNGALNISATYWGFNHAGALGGGFYKNTPQNVSITTSAWQGNTSDEDGGGLSLWGDGTTVIAQSTLRDNEALDDGGALHLANGGSAVLDGVSILGNRAGDMGGGLYHEDSSDLSVMSSSLLNNRAGNEGGAIMNNSADGQLRLSSIRLDDNAAVNRGGAIASRSNSTLEITGGSFSLNQAETDDGGALYLAGAAGLAVNDITFENNSAGDQGGAIYYGSVGAAAVESSRFNQNRTMGNGGAIYSAGDLVIANALVSGNSAQTSGGGFAIVGNGSLTLTDTVVENNNAVGSISSGGYGGGIALFNNATAQISGTVTTDAQGASTSASTRFEGNTAREDGGGIAALDSSRLQVQGALFRGNIAGDDGGGIAAVGRSQTLVTVENSNFENNRSNDKGGGFYRNNFAETTPDGILTATVADSRFIGNQSAFAGGGFFLGRGAGSADVQNSLLRANHSVTGGGLYSAGELTLRGSQVASNSAEIGGGLAFANSVVIVEDTQVSGNTASSYGGGAQVEAGARLVINNTTFEGNRAIAGGALFNQGTLEATNTTLSRNAAALDGGAIRTQDAGAELTLRNSTLSNNNAGRFGGGIAESDTQSARLLNTIVASNASASATDVSGTFIDQGNNLISEVDGATGFTQSTLLGTAAAPLDPQLAPLANNGGMTKTHLLQTHSPAINAASNVGGLVRDQRGLARWVGAATDIGAVELSAAELPASVLDAIAPNQPLPPVTISNSPTPALNPTSTPIAVLGNVPPSVLSSVLSSAFSNLNVGNNTGQDLSVQTVVDTRGDTRQSADNITIRRLEQSFSQSFEDYWNLSAGANLSFDSVQAVLRRAQEDYKVNSAVIYAVFAPAKEVEESTSSILRSEVEPADGDLLQLALVMPEGELVRYQLPVTRAEAERQVRLFRSTASDPDDELGYRPFSQQLYQWLLAPLEKDLAAQGIQNLMYALDRGLRTAPVSAMRDSSGFSLERYGISVVPSVGLMQADFPVRVRRSTVAMGVSSFQGESPLPAVPIELAVVKNFVSAAQTTLNEETTLDALEAIQALDQPGVLHLATHATFDPYSPESSYIHLWDDPLSMKEFSELDWADSDLELLILSACSTAMSSPNAELGFAGLAAASGVDATVGSLWQVSDIGTLALMSEFYAQLESTDLRFEALRKAQLALLNGETRIEDGNLQTSRGEVDLPDELGLPESAKLDHPFFWSAFTMVGNPW